jgi:hypothetical protein
MRYSSEVGKGGLYGSLLFNIMQVMALEQTPCLTLVLPTQKMALIWY